MIQEKTWRLNNLYRVINKDGFSVPFKLNPIQEKVIDNPHKRKLILKARQLGMTTLCVINLLDDILFNENVSAGIVSYSLEHASHIYKKIIGHSLDTFPQEFKPYIGINSRSAREISLNNGSFLRVDTSLRGGTYQNILVSEFGKTCARSPQKADEVVSGTLNAVPINGKVTIESTGEGLDGFFADMCLSAIQRGNKDLSPLEFELLFYPWFEEKTYTLRDKKIEIGVEQTDYFDKIEIDQGVKISQGQRVWYCHQLSILGDKMKQEFPSSPMEAFLSRSDAYYFAAYVETAYKENRCLFSSLYDPLEPVYVSIDLGVNDLTVMIFFQLVHGEIRVIDYYEDSNKGIDFYAKYLLQDRKYLYHTIFLPHDSVKRDPLDVVNSVEREFRKLFSATNTRFMVLPRTDKQEQISYAKLRFNRCVFNVSKVKPLLEHLSKYRKRWHEPTGQYLEEPLHDIHCFVGETLVLTDEGYKRIDSIKLGDFVVTPNGYKKVLNIYRKKTKSLCRVNYKANSVSCTPTHQIFTKNGVRIADSLVYSDQILTLEDIEACQRIGYLGMEKGLGFKDVFLSMSPEQLFILMGENTKRTNSDIGWVADGFIGMSGLIKKAQYLKDMIFTILMKINQIIQLKISQLYPIPTTCGCTCLVKRERNCQESMLEKPLKLQRTGTDRRRAEAGTESMEKESQQIKSRLSGYAYVAGWNLLQSKNSQNIAQKFALLSTEESLEKMTLKETVKCALKNMFAINIKKTKPVVEVVQLNLDTEKEVYDLTIEDDHCYYANSFLVSNSHYGDSFMYMAQASGFVERGLGKSNAMEKHKIAIEMRKNKV